MARFASLLAVLALTLLTGFAGTPMHRAMVELDQAYIPALALTNQSDLAKALAAQAQLERAWTRFSSAYRDAMPADPQWVRDFDSVGRALDQARVALDAGRPAEGHAALEQVRETFLALRSRNGMEYFLDRLTVFHAPMEVAVAIVQGRSGQSLGEADIERLRATARELRREWDAVLAARWTPEDYGLAGARLERARKALAAETAAMAELEAALAGSDRGRMVAAATAIRPPFSQLYVSFGVPPG